MTDSFGRARIAQGMSFERWLVAIDAYLMATVGVSYHDLPDAPFQDWFERGMKFNTAAKKLLRLAEGYDD
jgi:hypothetical protein